MKYYVLKYSDGKYVARNSPSGEYPYATDRLDFARIWTDVFYIAMLDYIRSLHLNVRIVEICDADEVKKELNSAFGL